MKKITFALASIFSLFLATSAFASGHEGGATGYFWALALGAGFTVGLAAGLAALGQSRAASAALEGIARNPQAQGKIQGPLIIALALMESLVLVAFGLAYLLQDKIPGVTQ